MKMTTWNIFKNSQNLWNFQTWKFHPTSLLTTHYHITWSKTCNIW